MAYLDVEDGRRIYFEHIEGRGRPVLNIHGWAMSVRAWDSVQPTLSERGHAVAAFDQRCCGQSDKDFRESSILASARDAIALIDHLGLEGVVLNGWSLGGAVTVEAASLLGSRCAALILTCGATPRYTQAEGFLHGATADDVRAMAAAITPNRAAFLHGLSRAVCAKPVGAPTEDWMWQIFLQASPGADTALGELATLDQCDTLAALDIPVLSIVGTADAITPPGIGETAAALARHGQLKRLEGCGHAPMVEDNEGYCAIVTAFLDRIG